MLKQKYFLTDFFILSAEKQPIKSSWRKIEWLLYSLYVLWLNRILLVLSFLRNNKRNRIFFVFAGNKSVYAF